MGKRKTRKRSRRGGEPEGEKKTMFGAYLGHETCAWYESIDSCSKGKCSYDKVQGKEKDKCGELEGNKKISPTFVKVGENISKFAPFTAASSWGSLIFNQLDKYKTPKLPEEMANKNLINAFEIGKEEETELLNLPFEGKKNVYYIIHEEISSSTKGPRWGLRVLRNCNVKKEEKNFLTIKSPKHTNEIEVTLLPDGKMILKWGNKSTPKVESGTLLFGDITTGGRKRRKRSTKKRRKRTKRKSRKKRKRTKKRRRRR